MEKKYKLSKNEIKKLIPEMGGSIATDAIMIEGLKIGYAYREKPLNDMDNGWRFFAGTESQEYLDDSSKSGVHSLNTIVNYDSSIIPYLELPIGTEIERIDNSDEFEIYFSESE